MVKRLEIVLKIGGEGNFFKTLAGIYRSDGDDLVGR